MRSQGFVPRDTQDLASPPVGGLHVIVASAAGPAGVHIERAFFFLAGHFIRTDLPDASARIEIAWRNNATIALGYAAYKGNEPRCCPKGGNLIVRFEWTGSRLKALDPIPSRAVRR